MIWPKFCASQMSAPNDALIFTTLSPGCARARPREGVGGGGRGRGLIRSGVCPRARGSGGSRVGASLAHVVLARGGDHSALGQLHAQRAPCCCPPHPRPLGWRSACRRGPAQLTGLLPVHRIGPCLKSSTTPETDAPRDPPSPLMLSAPPRARPTWMRASVLPSLGSLAMTYAPPSLPRAKRRPRGLGRSSCARRVGARREAARVRGALLPRLPCKAEVLLAARAPAAAANARCAIDPRA